MVERWLPIVGHENYEISDKGRVRSLDRMVVCRDGRRRRVTGRVLAAPFDGKYHTVTLERGRTRRVHILVLETFEGPRPAGKQGLHRDDNPHDNSWANLYWGTPLQNRLDAVRNGRDGNARKTHCKRGHEFTPENTYVIQGRRPRRECKTCRNDRVAKWHARRAGVY